MDCKEFKRKSVKDKIDFATKDKIWKNIKEFFLKNRLIERLYLPDKMPC